MTRIFIRDVAEPGFRGSSLSLVLLRCTEQGQESRETPLRQEVALTGWGLLEKRLPLGADSLSLEESVHPVPGNFPWDSRSWAGTGGRECQTVLVGELEQQEMLLEGAGARKPHAEALYSPSLRRQRGRGQQRSRGWVRNLLTGEV